jgi:2-methylisocitrate lyase-like PEP mutase family enzyme
MTEVTDTLALIRDRVGANLIVDADTGYGNALNVVRTVREFERAGATAIQLEDQDFPKRCGHLDGKSLVPMQEMCGKIRAAVDTRRSRETLIVARTDAVAVEGLPGALERAAAYRESGADVLFVEAPKTRDELASIVSQLGNALPLLANMVEGGKTPTLPANELEAIGFSIVIFPGAIVRAFGYMASEFYGSLAAHGSNEPYRNRMLDFKGINGLVGTPEMIALGQRYETGAAAKKPGTT